MVLLRLPLVVAGSYPGRNRLAVCARTFRLSDFRLRLTRLFLALRKHHAALLRTPVRSLPVDLGRIVQREKRIQQRVIRHPPPDRMLLPQPPHGQCVRYKLLCRSDVPGLRLHIQLLCPLLPASLRNGLLRPKSILLQMLPFQLPRYAAPFLHEGFVRSSHPNLLIGRSFYLDALDPFVLHHRVKATSLF